MGAGVTESCEDRQPRLLGGQKPRRQCCTALLLPVFQPVSSFHSPSSVCPEPWEGGVVLIVVALLEDRTCPSAVTCFQHLNQDEPMHYLLPTAKGSSPRAGLICRVGCWHSCPS